MWTLLLPLLIACNDKGSGPSGTPGSTPGPTTGITSCFTADTKVDTPTGPVRIAELSVGDGVQAWNLGGEVPVVRAVTALHRREVDQLVILDVGGRRIETTAEHPFYSLSEDDWVEAGLLVPGEVLAAPGGVELVGVPLDEVEVVPGAVEVYNLTVGGPEHDYFAGGVLVHNKTVRSGTTPPPFLPIFAWTDVDAAPPSDTDGDDSNDLNCSSDTLDILINDPLLVDDWTLGMAEVGSSGWTGEDCLNGQAGYNLCHAITASDQLVEVCTPAEIVPGDGTLFDHSKDPFLTYYLDDRGDCFVMGNDPSYYDSLGCQVLN